MKYSIGYQLPGATDSTVEIVRDYREHISEVYFALPYEPSGRMPVGMTEYGDKSEIEQIFLEDLGELAKMDIRLVLLFNAACYGSQAASAEFARKICAQISELSSHVPISAVTTTSPFVGGIISHHFPEIEIRASVNMKIGSIREMEYLSDRFDSFYLKRDYNRDIEHIESVGRWCKENKKKLHLLANSGCLYSCAWQQYHDNLVAHQTEADDTPIHVMSPCWEYLSKPQNHVRILQNTWIRPEDIHHYEKWFDQVKLATRLHPNPRLVVSAYAQQSFKGNLLDLLEPNHSALLYPMYIDNARFPESWFEKTSRCGRKCEKCNWCKNVLQDVMTDIASACSAAPSTEKCVPA